MTITRGLMAPGEWSLTLTDNCPAAIVDRLNDWASMLVATTQQVDVDIFPSLTSWLYRGIVMARSGERGATGHGMAWLLGTAATTLQQTEGSGPYYVNVVAGETPAATITALANKNGITPGTTTGVTGTITAGWHATLRTILDVAICPQTASEWRLSDALVLSLVTQASAVAAAPVALIARTMGGSEPSTPLVGLDISAITPTIDFGDYRNRYAINYNSSASWVNSTVTAGFNAPDGTGLEVCGFATSGTADSTAATNYANYRRNMEAHATRALTINIDNYLIDAQVPNLSGANIQVFDPILGLYDLTNPVDWHGTTIYPTKIRCVGSTVPFTRGTGVYLDNRHQGGVVTDITKWVAWEDTGDNKATSTLQLGAPPVTWKGTRRAYAS